MSQINFFPGTKNEGGVKSFPEAGGVFQLQEGVLILAWREGVPSTPLVYLCNTSKSKNLLDAKAF